MGFRQRTRSKRSFSGSRSLVRGLLDALSGKSSVARLAVPDPNSMHIPSVLMLHLLAFHRALLNPLPAIYEPETPALIFLPLFCGNLRKPSRLPHGQRTWIGTVQWASPRRSYEKSRSYPQNLGDACPETHCPSRLPPIKYASPPWRMLPYNLIKL